MTEPVIRPVQQLLRQVFSDEQRETYTDFCNYLENGGSIFPLVEQGVQGLVSHYRMKPDDARAFLRRANSLAVFVRRQFIEHSLRGSQTRVTRPDSGLLSMVAGPSYESLFSTNFDGLCPPQALESIASPVAYLIELLRWIEEKIHVIGGEEKLDLHVRRQDLKRLLVDFNAVHQAVSALDIIVPVLETFIEENDSEQDLEEALIQTRYPNGLPYYQHWVTLDFVAREHGLSVGNIAHMVDLAYPYFLQPEAWDNDAGRAFTHASRLGPYQRELLTEVPIEPDDTDARDAYYERNFGTPGTDWLNLNQVKFFGERTGLDTREIEALLSIREFAPTRSANVSVYDSEQPGADESQRSGSVYLNAATIPALSIDYREVGKEFLHRFTQAPEIIDRYERMNRKLRLDRWLELPSEQVDALLTAAIRAEARHAIPANPWWISTHQVHALGLFQSLRERYGCSAEDFAAFIDEISIYGRANVLSLFDRTFNSQGNYRQPLLLDGATFATLPVQGVAELTISQLCSGLGIDLQTYAYLAVAIERAHGFSGTLERTTAVISSFYRLVKLPRLLGITPVEGVLMLTLLGGESWVDGLAGLPQVHARLNSETTPDVLNLVYALHSCVSWCKDREIPVLWMLQQVAPLQALAVATQAEQQLFEQIRNLLPAALFNNAGLSMAGVPSLEGLDWLRLLTELVDPTGLVIDLQLPETDYLSRARVRFDQAIREGLGENDASVRGVLVERMLGVLLQAREAQVSVARECLAVYTGLDTERGLLMLTWAQSTVYQLLSQVSARADRDATETPSPAARAAEQADPLLNLLADVRRRSAVASKLELSAVLLEDFLRYGHKAWMAQDDRHLLSIRTLYYLSALGRAFALSEQPAGKLLDYLRQVNALPTPLSSHALRLAQDAAALRLAAFFDWSVQEVRECVSRIDPALKILKTLPQLDLLMRIRVLARHSGMDALTIFLVGNLPEDVDKAAYRTAAERALLSLSDTREAVVTFADEVTQPLVTMTCVVDKTEVVAGKTGEKVLLTVTLKDADDQPLSGVNVYWQVSLGTIVAKATEFDGTVTVEYLPGKVMGQETPLFWLDLIDAQQAPTIHISDDAVTLSFPGPLTAQVPLQPVPAGQEVELYATLRDVYQNPGRNRLVRWFAEPVSGSSGSPVIRPEQNHADFEGVTRVYVSIPSGGEFIFSVRCDANDSETFFDPITFTEALTHQ
ncbi:Tc toxin subunit A [Pseudomonas sp. AM14(2022)]|uniref:Tc toxin subunit A n=1 Tax=Pseudomonas sp. AM14(2022) TaxID=2983371 RepID=UPI002E81245F|nr:Tc toxin subunit A [Pseudomonas sp. AM14(2022)]